LKVVAEAGNGRDAVRLAQECQPDIIVMDLGLPDISGLETIRLIREQDIKSRIVVLSMYIRREFVRPAIEAGCDGYVPKSSTHTSLLEAIRVVLTGERYLHPKAATALVESVTAKETEADLYQQLSEREQDVLRLTALGDLVKFALKAGILDDLDD
ncbi:MAG: response regulator transcription factor, partial [Anaerolineae bacterium]